ncbi:hypothetical protein RQP54_08960 [Curvibacter sp. APW13]|uniref:DUF6671 family protein n=1 Tax=Curvibacter sp. APW13 TaxID=3077236 RepID=UPI0028DDA1E7|nr:DUF6671 family protein [Curvibacter sp. APW13]MDT8990990.1 hypothetical protein [Curvibacter sp. APW13]
MVNAALPFQGLRVGFVTQHGKESLVAPHLEPLLGCVVERVDGIDTDRFGTFTRDIPRSGTQLEAARRKAQAAFETGDWPLALASEGAFGVDPYAGLMPWNVEVLVLLDRRTGREVAAHAQGPALAAHSRVGSEDALRAFAQEAGFPHHHLVVRQGDENGPVVAKGLHTDEALLDAFWRARQGGQGVFVEHDLRAFCNPTRQAVIANAAKQLAQKLASACPQCAAPGFWPVRHSGGLPCEACGTPTHLPRLKVWGCSACGHEEQRPHGERPSAPAASCPACNP